MTEDYHKANWAAKSEPVVFQFYSFLWWAKCEKQDVFLQAILYGEAKVTLKKCMPDHIPPMIKTPNGFLPHSK